MKQKTWQVLSVAMAGLFIICLAFGVNQALASKYFTFTYTYSEGDVYQGRGYINSTSPDYSLYIIGYTKTMMDESKNNGTYKITNVTMSSDESKNNYIYVDKYYDKESDNMFIPVSVGKAVGTQGLGSERDYIQETGKSCFYFGYYSTSTYKYIAEADVSVIYSFNYTFGNGDYYTGTVYAKPTYGYYYKSSTDFYSFKKKDENDQLGVYVITGIKGYYDHSNDGKVIINQYFNSEDKTIYNPVSIGSRGYLGYEYGWIIKSNEPQFYFGNYNNINYEADVGNSSRYTFTYLFKNGDKYEGFVYAPASQGYFVGYTKSLADEHGLLGEYKITGAIGGFDNRRDGQVFVTKYYDNEGNKSFTPVGFRSPESNTPVDNLAKGVGLNYLGSEKDYIIRNNVPEYFFGAGLKNSIPVIFEADLVWVEYAFKYTYSNGDFYEGTVWARMDYGYYAGYSKATIDENGSQGKYYISSFKLLYEPIINDDLMGKVIVNKYYDKEANATFTPVSAGEAVGWEYLGSEYDYIIQAGKPEFFFGGGYYEAEVACAYSFKFFFGNGDYYTGTVYAPPGYNNAPKIKDENGLIGNYYLLGVRAYVDSSLNGQVYLSRYYDAESQKTYTPLRNNLPAGNNFLGSEGGYIISQGSADFYFGKGKGTLDPNTFYEADQAYRYNFQFTYGGKDYYTGYVFGAPNLYSLTYKKNITDENGKIGSYTITGITSGFDLSQNGKVFVSSYYDAETGNTYTPVNSSVACGTNYLGSEINYIIQNNNDIYRFGKYTDGKFYEADIAANIAYNFIFYYNDKNGDYYQGIVYRSANNIYYKNYTLNKVDENGQNGYYIITGGSPADDSSNNGKVIVTSYYNYENNTTYTPLNVTGANYLGSETGFIFKTTNLLYRFGYYGGKFYEADVN